MTHHFVRMIGPQATADAAGEIVKARFPVQPLRRRPLAACLVAAMAVLPLPHEAHAGVLPVTSCADDGSPGTLRSVVASAHDDDTIDLTQLTCSTITLRLGGIDMHNTSGLIFNGPGQDRLTISGRGASPILHADFYNTALTLRDLTLAHGYAGRNLPNFYYAAGCLTAASAYIVLERVTITDCKAVAHTYQGGGAVVAGFLNLVDSTVSHSSIRYDAFAVHGGGILANGAALVRSTVSDNTVLGGGTASANVASGGGLFVGGTLVMIGSSVSGNRVRAPSGYDIPSHGSTGGGGVYSFGALYVINSTITNNTVMATNAGENGDGGGIFVRGSLMLVGSTVSGNDVDGDGGGLYKFGYPDLFDHGTTLTIQNSTIADNAAGGAGAAFVSQRPTWIDNSTIAGNSGAAGAAAMFSYREKLGYRTNLLVDVQSTIIGANTAGPNPTYATDLAADDVLTVTGAHSLIMDAAAGIVLPPDTLRSDPLLLPLADNGGPTWTMALVSGSPAIDTGSNPLGLQADQRGSPWVRVYGAAPDIGAFEVQPPPDPIFANGFDP